MWSSINLAAAMLFLPMVFSQAAIVTPTITPPTLALQPTTTPPVNVLAPASYSYAFVYTTPTTMWSAPSFATATASPIQACSDYAALCPSGNGQTCQDSFGAVYGIICDNRFSGTVITSFGKRRRNVAGVKRINTESLDSCLGFCDQYDMSLCLGSDFRHGTCMNYAAFFGTIAEVGRVAFVRQSQGTGVDMEM